MFQIYALCILGHSFLVFHWNQNIFKCNLFFFFNLLVASFYKFALFEVLLEKIANWNCLTLPGLKSLTFLFCIYCLRLFWLTLYILCECVYFVPFRLRHNCTKCFWKRDWSLQEELEQRRRFLLLKAINS